MPIVCWMLGPSDLTLMAPVFPFCREKLRPRDNKEPVAEPGLTSGSCHILLGLSGRLSLSSSSWEC
jgi:hypothetical protein